MTSLMVVDDERDRAWPIGDSISIGRAIDNTIVVEDPRVAARHAVIERRAGSYRLVDLGSRDGTYVRGRRVASAEADLVEGDEIVVGVESFRISRAIAVDERELAKLRACLAVSRCLGDDQDTERVLERILVTIGDVLDVDRGAVALVDPHTHEPTRRTCWSRDAEPIPPLSRTMLREALVSTRGVVVNDIAVEPRFTRSKSLSAQGVRAVVCLPLRHGNEELGVLYLDSRRSREPFARSDLDLLWALAGQAALVVKNALLREALVIRTRVAEDANKQKTQFLRNMSHELRTPLNGVIGFAELLQGGSAGPLVPLQHEFVGDILASARHLVAVINELIDLSIAESGRIALDLASVVPAQLVDEVCKAVAPLADAAGVTVTATIDDSIGIVQADSTRLRQVIYNLVSNAIKFTPEGGRVVVRVLAAGSTAYRIEVEDTGLGIRREDLARVFVEAKQFEHHKFPGAGLGLVLTRRIVEAHGGQVGVESERDRGSRFHAVFPRAAIVT